MAPKILCLIALCFLAQSVFAQECQTLCQCCTPEKIVEQRTCDNLQNCVDPAVCEAEGNYIDLPQNFTFRADVISRSDFLIDLEFREGAQTFDVEIVPTNTETLECKLETGNSISKVSATPISLSRFGTVVTGLSCSNSMKRATIACNQPVVFNLPHHIELLQATCCRGRPECSRAGSEQYCFFLQDQGMECDWDCCQCKSRGDNENAEDCPNIRRQTPCENKNSCLWDCTDTSGACCNGGEHCTGIRSADICDPKEKQGCFWVCLVSDTYGEDNGQEGGNLGDGGDGGGGQDVGVDDDGSDEGANVGGTTGGGDVAGVGGYDLNPSSDDDDSDQAGFDIGRGGAAPIG